MTKPSGSKDSKWAATHFPAMGDAEHCWSGQDLE